MKNPKRFGALLLTLVLSLSLAVPAFAAVDDTGYSDVAADACMLRPSCTVGSIT